MKIELKLDKIKPACKSEPFKGKSFLIYTTTETFEEEKLEKLIEGLKIWRISQPNIDVEFTEAQGLVANTIFALTMTYSDIFPIDEELMKQTIDSIQDNFSLFLNQRVEDLNK